MRTAAERLLRQETGLSGVIEVISPEFSEELWPTEGFTPAEWSHYDPATKYVHYIAAIAFVRVENTSSVVLDDQSESAMWTKEIPCKHPFLLQYFEMLKRAGLALQF